jgi:hypothetical protein
MMKWLEELVAILEKLFGKKKKKKEDHPDGDLPFDWDKLQVLSSGTDNPGSWEVTAKLLNVSIGNTINYGNVEGGIPDWPTGIGGHNHCIGFVYQPESLKASRGGYYCTGEWGNPGMFVNDGSKPFMSVRGSKTFFSGPMKDFVPNGQEVWIIITTINWLQQRTINKRLSAVKARLTS